MTRCLGALDNGNHNGNGNGGSGNGAIVHFLGYIISFADLSISYVGAY